MREIPLTNGGVALVDDEDYESLSAHRWQRHKRGYAYRYTRSRPAPGRCHLMHRVIMDAPSGVDVDHINGVPADNRRSNLRLCCESENLANRGKQSNNKSGYKGVSRSGPNLWRARCGHVELGHFNTKEAAALAYNIAAVEMYGEFARLNDLTTAVA